MTKRVIMMGILAGIALFAWGVLSHMVLGLGEIGIKELPNEQAVLSAMKGAISQPGLYFFPGSGLGPEATREQRMAAMQEVEKKAATGPTGILVIHPEGGGGLTAARLINEFALNVVEALLLAILLAWSGDGRSYGSRVAFVTVAGLFAALATNVQYWNWYGFPSNYTVAYIANEFLGFLVVGLVLAAGVRTGPLSRAGD